MLSPRDVADLFMLPRFPRLAVFAAVAAAIALLGAGSHSFFEQLATARAEASTARAAMTDALRHADSAAATTAAFRVQIQQIDAQKHAAVARADSSELRARHFSATFAAIAKTAPDTCRQVIAAADSTIGALVDTNVGLRLALQQADSARILTQAALDTTSGALARLRVTGAALVHADAVLSKASRPSLFTRIMPHPGIGAALGVDAAGAPHLVVGATLGWRF